MFSIQAFLLMAGAALLGFLICWVWVKNKLDVYQTNQKRQLAEQQELKQNYTILLQHSNAQQGEKEKLIQKIDDLNAQLLPLQKLNKQLEEDKKNLVTEFKSIRKERPQTISLSREMTSEIASLKSRIDELSQEKENWREKYMIVRHANDEHIAKLSALEKEKEMIEEELFEIQDHDKSGSHQSEKEKIDWREEYQQLQKEFNGMLGELKETHGRLRKEYDEMKQHYSEELDRLKSSNEQLNRELHQTRKGKLSDSSDQKEV